MRRAAAGPVPGLSRHLIRQPDGDGISWNCQHTDTLGSPEPERFAGVGLRAILIAVRKMSRSSGENIRSRIRCDEKCTHRRLTVRSTNSHLSRAKFMSSQWVFISPCPSTGNENACDVARRALGIQRGKWHSAGKCLCRGRQRLVSSLRHFAHCHRKWRNPIQPNAFRLGNL